MILVALLAVCWLVYRLVRFVTIPVSSIVATLGVRTPAAAKVSVDKVTADSITVHWENEPLEMVRGREEEAVCYYILYLNGFQIAVFHNNPKALYTCCNIKGLDADAEYQFDFVSINRMGYVNKLPSVYCKTSTVAESNHVSSELEFGEIPLLQQQQQDSDGELKKRWRRNTLKKGTVPTLTKLGPEEIVDVHNINAENYPSYNSLTTLKALENYTVEDLKKILVCAQEDLHDVLSQEQTLMEDFHESQEQLQLELENLKTNWSHEINLRKTLKSSIKSLENSKMLTDLKSDKLKKKINDLKFKISRMEKDMKDWNKENETLCNKDIKRNFEECMKKNNELEEQLKLEVENLQKKLSEEEEEYKKLLANKPASENVKRNNTSSEKIANPADDKNSALETIIKEIEPLLSNFSKINPNNPPFSKLNPNSEILKLIKEQKSLEQKSEAKWKSRKSKALRKLEALENKYKDIESKNDQLRAQMVNTTSTTENFNNNTPKRSFQNTQSTDGMDLSNRQQPFRQVSDSENLQSISTGSPNFNNEKDMLNHAPLMLHHPSTYSNMNGPVNYPMMSPPNQNSYLQSNNMNFNSERGQPIAPMLTNVSNSNMLSSSPWNSNYQFQNVEPSIAYDDANHLITGLEDMIHDEADYPESISNYSNVFTTDQLDNYWLRQKNKKERGNPEINIQGNNEVSNVHAAADFLSPQPSMHSQASQYDNMLGTSYSQDRIPLSNSPMGPYGHAHKNSIGIQPSHAQSLLTATLNNSYQDQFSFNNVNPFFSNNNNRQLQDSMKSLDLSNDMLRLPGGNSMPNRDASPLQFNFIPSNNSTNNDNNNQTDHHSAAQVSNGSEQLLSPNQYSKSIKDSDSGGATINPFWSGNSSNHSKEETPRRRNTNESKEVQTVGHATPKSHKRNQSNSSISSWTKLSWKNLTSNPSSPQRGSIDESSEEIIDEENEKPPTTRKMSRLLSRSTMNSIFKKPTHESN